MLTLSAQRDVAHIRRSAQAKLTDVERRIAALERMREGLKNLIEACPGNGQAADCPILKALAAGDGS